MSKKEALEQINEALEPYNNIQDVIEILSNVLIIRGMSVMDIPSEHQRITPANIADIVLADRKENGETIHNALVLQGLTMLMWVEEKK